MDRSATAPPVAVRTATQVADLLEEVYRANRRMATGADRDTGPSATASQTAVDRPADELRPGALARAQLSDLDPDLLLAGTSVWLARLRTCVQGSAERAESPSTGLRWTGGLPA